MNGAFVRASRSTPACARRETAMYCISPSRRSAREIRTARPLSGCDVLAEFAHEPDEVGGSLQVQS